MPGLPWTEHITVVPWDEVAVMRSPKKQSNKDKPTYDVYVDGWKCLTDLDTTKPIYYIGIKERRERGISLKQFPDGQFVVVSANRIDALKRKYPTAKSAVEVLRERVETFYAGVSEDQLRMLSIDWSTRNRCAMLDVTRIEDPEVIDLITTIKDENEDIKKFRDEWDVYRDIAWKVNYAHKVPDYKPYSIYDRYPLLGSLQSHCVEHAYIYINGVYNKLLKEKND